ncbi:MULTISPECIES: HXXEE domain-containing protein [Streptococcaceae]|uniref:HXXEE domain-containing protein n=1 Tax=Streptococcus dysgalactiae subsp. dysgalactiae TaxID=99822 RepID=A0A9X7RXG9_STRDY|nr:MULTISPECIES: HXXEE domain-containing protein [Streptococcaceae]ASX19248.1 hypothetical protein BGL51_04385 [Streptococcus thermophilus]MCT2891415.1 HXXEE domain-containing protein [Streptococcus thermophilus]MCT2967777.1 HXXEE domain-containing protein [Streptococcus thermophilus]MCT2972550.1 HXXEE domain-containing protein [Streptococcus thermophilus]MDT2749917.1 HXXEE domain-containing protein [Streptococcus parauberis]
MTNYIWLFPLLFIFHDLEEIIGLIPWTTAHQELLKEKAPLFLKLHQNLSIEGFAFAVLEEFIVVSVVSLLAVTTSLRFFSLLWLGGVIAYTVHLLFHILQSLSLKSYIPSLITSIICFPISVWLIRKCTILLQATPIELVVYSILGLLIVVVNLFFALRLGKIFSVWLSRKIN